MSTELLGDGCPRGYPLMALDTLPKWRWAGEAVRSWLSKHGPNTGQYADRLTLPYLGSCGAMMRSRYGHGIEPPVYAADTSLLQARRPRFRVSLRS